MRRPFRGVAPRVHPTAFIHASAQVIGEVEIGEASRVWMCVVLRGDVNRIRIGCRTAVQNGAMVQVMAAIHESRIGGNRS